MKDSQPKAIYLKDYRAPDYWIDHTSLNVDLYEDHALVTAVLDIRHNPDHLSDNLPDLELVGDDLELISVALNDQPFADFQLGNGQLKLPVPGKQFCSENRDSHPAPGQHLAGRAV